MKIALIGATGMVGGVMLEILKERNFPFDELFLVASESSIGKKIMFLNNVHLLAPSTFAASRTSFGNA